MAAEAEAGAAPSWGAAARGRKRGSALSCAPDQRSQWLPLAQAALNGKLLGNYNLVWKIY